MADCVKSSVAALKSLPVLHHSADYIFSSFGINDLIFCYFECRVSPEDLIGGVNRVVFTTTIYKQTLLFMNRLSKTESGLFISCLISLLQRDLLFETYLEIPLSHDRHVIQ